MFPVHIYVSFLLHVILIAIIIKHHSQYPNKNLDVSIAKYIDAMLRQKRYSIYLIVYMYNYKYSTMADINCISKITAQRGMFIHLMSSKLKHERKRNKLFIKMQRKECGCY